MTSPLTEIEGAILSEIEHRGQKTAFQVRKAFEQSPSFEWSGSAGSVYPAIKRMTARGLIVAHETGDKRATKHIALTEKGREALDRWTMDVERGISVGLDPFRLRSGIWPLLTRERHRTHLHDLATAITDDIVSLKSKLGDLDPVERERIELNIDLQQFRLSWIEKKLNG